MSQRSEQAKHAVKAPPRNTGKRAEMLSSTLAIRLVVAVVIFAVTLIVKMPTIVRIILLILSVVVAGYDVFLEAINSVEDSDYFAIPLIIVFISAIGFVVGYAAESVALVILYQISGLALKYVAKRTKASAADMLKSLEPDAAARMRETLEGEGAGRLTLERSVGDSAAMILRFAMAFAVVFAIVVPLFTAFPFRVSIHRALMIILLATPTSVVAAMPLTGIVGLCTSAQKGILFQNAAGLEKAAEVNAVVIDKEGIFSDDSPELLSVRSELLDKDTFMNFAAHAVYYSDQPFARAISAIYDQEYKLAVISDFRDLPGSGVELKIGGAPVLLATQEYLAKRGAKIPQSADEEGTAYHLIVSGRYIGKLVLSSSVNENTGSLAAGMNDLGITRCVLLSEAGSEETQRLAEELGFSDYAAVGDTSGKLRYLSEVSGGKRNQVMYVYANGIEQHSAASVDVRVSKRAKFADAVALPADVANVPAAVAISRRMMQIAKMNALFAFGVKALLIFLSILGYCTLWFAIFVDMAAAIATMLNTIRVSIPPRERVRDDFDDDEDLD